MAVAESVKVLDQFVVAPPSPQNALDLFRGDWSSAMPGELADFEAGSAPLFDDARIRWLSDQVGGFEGKRVLELGPLEAGHTYMLERGGAAEVVAVEANTRAYLRCLVVKELTGLVRSKFLCGDFVEYLRAPGPRFDLCVACGVLYHMRDPVELIGLLADRCDGDLMLWTHYYDPAVHDAEPIVRAKFPGVCEEVEHRGFAHTLHRYEYGDALGWSGFCGGTAPFANWLSRDDLLACLDHFGFEDVRVGHDEPGHQHGPCLTLVARRRR